MFVFLTGTVKHGGVDQKSRVQIKQLLRSGRNEIEDLGGPWQFPAQGEFGRIKRIFKHGMIGNGNIGVHRFYLTREPVSCHFEPSL